MVQNIRIHIAEPGTMKGDINHWVQKEAEVQMCFKGCYERRELCGYENADV